MDLNKAYVLDIETNNLLANMLSYKEFPYRLNEAARLWCVVIRNVGTNEVFKAELGEVTKEWMRESLKDCEYLIAHNGIKFDFIALWLFGVLDYRVGYPGQDDTLFGKKVVFLDTLIMSRLFNPDRYNGHSLESWGERTGNAKTDFRAQCIEAGLIDSKAPRGAEFRAFTPLMTEYCIQDTNTNRDTFLELIPELETYKGWIKGLKMETKLADLAVRRESFGFAFDKKLAVECLEDLGAKMQKIEDSINPILPPKKMGKTELAKYVLPKIQFKKNGDPSAALVNAVERLGGFLNKDGAKTTLLYEDNLFTLPYHEPLKTYIPATIKDLDHIKMFLISLGWDPLEWRERDLTKDSKKQPISTDKREKALQRWVEETTDGKYKEARLRFLGVSEYGLYEQFSERIYDKWPVRVPTSPMVRVGVEKELCPNLVKLGDKVAFASDFALYLTYKHRRSCIAGGEIEDMDFDLEYPNTGYLSSYREEDGRIPTPSIEIGAATNRYRHIGVANVPRVTSEYGDKMRALFGAGKGFIQLGFDFSSLEARIQGHYCWKYTEGESLAATLLAEKPLDIHTQTGLKLGIPRSDAKSINYAILYGAAVKKIQNMLACTPERASEIFEGFWNSVPALKELKEAVEKHWESNDKVFVVGIDGRKINIRSKHSILNALFQSAGVICAKWVTVLVAQYLEDAGLNIDPFLGKPQATSMIEYHDEVAYATVKELLEFKTFDTEDEAKEFVTNWSGDQLSAISHGKKWYVCLPNILSRAIEDSIRKTEKIVNLNVPLGFEFIVGNNWAECH